MVTETLGETPKVPPLQNVGDKILVAGRTLNKIKMQLGLFLLLEYFCPGKIHKPPPLPTRGALEQPPRGAPWVSGFVGHFVQTWPGMLSHSAVLRL